jgi:hypothetical protein
MNFTTTSTQERKRMERQIEQTRRAIQTARLLGNFDKANELKKRLNTEQEALREGGR